MLNKHEKEMYNFLLKYPDQWHSYAKDKQTLRTLGSLYFYRGLGIRGLEVNRETSQMKLNKKEHLEGLK